MIRIYRFVVDHLTKFIGVIGLAVMGATEWIDPETVMGAAMQYLNDQRLIHRIGAFLFVLVIARGWWTGRKVRQLKAAAAPPPGAPQ